MAINLRDHDENVHYFKISHEKSAKIKNRRSSGHQGPDNRRFASWQTIITYIQSGNIGGLAGRYQSLPFSLWILRTSPRIFLLNPKILGGSLGNTPYKFPTVNFISLDA